MTSSVVPEPGPGRPLLAIVAWPAAVVLGILAGFLYVGLQGRTPSSTSTSRVSATRSSTPHGSPTPTASPTDLPYDGLVAPITPVSVTASCTAKDATDDGGHTVTYRAANTIDGRPSTAWRCDGNGVGKTLTITLPPNSRIAQLGLINGYAKVDPTSKVHRYTQYRRILEVSWTFPDGTIVPQTFSDTEDLQPLRIPVTTADRLTLTIKRSSAPGEKDTPRDAVLISEIGIATPA